MEHKPIKRSRHMVILSRDHHAGLQFCWKIKEGLKMDVSTVRIADYVQFFWESHLKQHFSEEEILLFNLLRDELTLIALEEHRLLSAWFAKIIAGEVVTKEEYHGFTTQLIDHIRFEEREVFPFLETSLPVGTLECIGDILTKLHAMPFVDNYPDEFWLATKETKKP